MQPGQRAGNSNPSYVERLLQRELEDRVSNDMKVAFSMFPTTMDDLLSIADAGEVMPPKSTWFEPKLRSGLFVHKLSD